MGLLDFFISRRSKLEKKETPYDSARWGDYKRGINLDGDSAELMTYSGQLPWVSIAVDAITRDVASQEFYFTNLNGEIIDMRRVPDPIRVPFELGYGGLSFVQILKFLIPNRLLAGNAYLWRTKSTAYGAIRQIDDSFIPLSACHVKVCLNHTHLGIEHYEVTLCGHRYIVPPDEMIHFRQNAAINPFIGVGNIAKMRLLAEGEIAATEYINSFLVDSVKMPLMTVIEEGNRDLPDMMRFQSMLKQKYSPRMTYLSGEKISIIQSNLLQKDIEFLEMRRDDRQATLSVFGVPPVVAGIPDSSNRASSGNQFAGYYGSTINPILRELADDFTRQHVWKFDRNLRLQFKLHPSADITAVTTMLQNAIITPNRAAELMGEEFDLNDETRSAYYFPSTYLPIGFVPEPVPVSTEDDPVEPEKNLSDPRNVKAILDAFSKSATRPKQFQRAYLAASLKSRNQVEERFVGGLARYFKAQEDRIMEKLRAAEGKALKDVGLNIDELFNLQEEAELLAEEIRPLHTSGVQKSIGDLNNITGRRVNLNLSNPFVKAAINRLGAKITGDVPQTTRKELQRLLTKSTDESWNINQLQDAIQGKFDQFQGYRARMIARTESRAAWDAGAQVAYSEIGVKTVDVVGCTQFEPDSDCGRQDIPISMIPALTYHPNHIGCLAPSVES